MEFQRRLGADIETVWQFLVDPAKRKLWFCGGSTDDHVGGTIVLEFDHSNLSESAPPEKYASGNTSVYRCEILEFDPPRKLAFNWFETDEEGPSKVTITLEPVDGGKATRLHLVHTGVGGRQMQISVLSGWHGHFDLLEEVVTGPRKTDYWLLNRDLENAYSDRV
jgi:uncharacterized protein YndB with AHSA1/START domain